MSASGKLHHVDLLWIDISEERIASIFMVEKSASEVSGWAGSLQTEPQVENAQLYKNLSVHTVDMALNFNGLPNNAIHVSGFSGHVRGIVKLNAVSQADTVFSHGWLVWMF
jgi:hypothetical protein